MAENVTLDGSRCNVAAYSPLMNPDIERRISLRGLNIDHVTIGHTGPIDGATVSNMV
jgi:hypothetical protein